MIEFRYCIDDLLLLLLEIECLVVDNDLVALAMKLSRLCLGVGLMYVMQWSR